MIREERGAWAAWPGGVRGRAGAGVRGRTAGTAGSGSVLRLASLPWLLAPVAGVAPGEGPAAAADTQRHLWAVRTRYAAVAPLHLDRALDQQRAVRRDDDARGSGDTRGLGILRCGARCGARGSPGARTAARPIARTAARSCVCVELSARLGAERGVRRGNGLLRRDSGPWCGRHRPPPPTALEPAPPPGRRQREAKERGRIGE